jgi:hypothetical protein
VYRGDRTTYSELCDAAPVPACDPRQLYAAVELSVAIQTRLALVRTGLRPGVPVVTEGGFRNNEPYLATLSALIRDSPLVLTSLEEATSFGAAITAKVAYEQSDPLALRDLVRIETATVDRTTLPGIEQYVARFEQLARNEQR